MAFGSVFGGGWILFRDYISRPLVAPPGVEPSAVIWVGVAVFLQTIFIFIRYSPCIVLYSFIHYSCYIYSTMLMRFVRKPMSEF